MKTPSTLPKSPYQETLLEPVNPKFIWLTIFLAMLFNFFPWENWHGIPDLLALVIVFWSLREPYFFGITSSFIIGLVIDVHQGALLGQHALWYSLLSFSAIIMQKRILWFPPRIQSLYIFLIFVINQSAVWLIVSALTQTWQPWWWLIDHLVACLIWPVLSWALLAPQRRTADRDDNRPI